MIFILLSFAVSSASAAPCCAGASAVPSLITGDEAHLFGISMSNASVVADVPGAGKGLPVFRDELSTSETRRNFTLNAATLISDRFQVGASLPLIQNQISNSSKNESRAQLGDLSMSFGFEALPEWEYSKWKPRVYTFVQWVAPTGRSIAETQNSLAADVSGLGFHQFHLGAVAIKRWNDWDANLVTKLGTELSHGSLLFSGGAGAGFSFFEIWRAGMSLEAQYQSPQKIADVFTSQKLVWNTGATLTALVGADSSLIVGYTDQTLFGPAINTTLARSFSLAYQQRWER